MRLIYPSICYNSRGGAEGSYAKALSALKSPPWAVEFRVSQSVLDRIQRDILDAGKRR